MYHSGRQEFVPGATKAKRLGASRSGAGDELNISNHLGAEERHGMANQYSPGFKARIVQKLLAADGVTAKELSEEVGVAQSTLSRWKHEAGTMHREQLGCTGRRTTMGTQPNKRTAEAKLRLVIEAAQLSDDELGAFLRKEGIHQCHLDQWRSSMLEALEGAHKKRSKRGPEARKVKSLERELKRKEKALAEAAALLMLKKKAHALWGDEDDDTTGNNAR